MGLSPPAGTERAPRRLLTPDGAFIPAGVVDIEGRDFHPALIAPGTGRNDLERSVRKGRSLRGATGILDALISAFGSTRETNT